MPLPAHLPTTYLPSVPEPALRSSLPPPFATHARAHRCAARVLLTRCCHTRRPFCCTTLPTHLARRRAPLPVLRISSGAPRHYLFCCHTCALPACPRYAFRSLPRAPLLRPRRCLSPARAARCLLYAAARTRSRCACACRLPRLPFFPAAARTAHAACRAATAYCAARAMRARAPLPLALPACLLRCLPPRRTTLRTRASPSRSKLSKNVAYGDHV